MASSSSSSIPQQTSDSDTITNNSNSKSASASIRNSQPHHSHPHASSTPISAPASPTPVVAAGDGPATSTQGHTHTQPPPNNSHEQHFYQHQQHSRSHSAALGGVGTNVPLGGMPGPGPPPSSSSQMGQISSPGPMGVPNAPYYYHPYTLFPPPPAPPHSHHGPPPPHPPAPPAPPRANRTNSVSQLQDGVLHHQRASADVTVSPFLSYATTPSSVQGTASNESTNGPAGRRRGPSTSASPSLRGISTSASSPSSPSISASTPSFVPSSLSSSMSSRPQLIPTFQYYRSQTNYDKQHMAQRGENQGSNNAAADTMSAQLHAGRIPSIPLTASAANDNDQHDNDNDNDNDNGVGVEDYDGDLSTVAMHTAMDLPIDPSILPAVGSNMLPAAASSSTSSSSNYMLPGSEKRPNHEYYPSPHHQVQFRELMAANNSTQLPDPPISLNSLVDSEPGRKPAYPLPTIIRCAILGSPHERLTLSELYLAMERRFSYYTLGDGKSWRNSVRHNLSLNNLFEKVARPITEPGKGCYWVVAHDKPPGNKRERKRNKKPGKKALAAMEREKAAAAAAATSSAEAQAQAVSVGSSRQTDDEDEGDDAGEDEDDVDDSRVDPDQTITLSSSTAPRRRNTATGGSSTSALPTTTTTTTSNVSAFSPYMIRPPFGNAYSRGTVAPNEGSYAAVTGVMPMLNQLPLPAGFGIGMGVDPVSGSATAQASSASGVGFGANSNDGPFSAYVPQNGGGGNPSGFNRNNASLYGNATALGFGNPQAQTGTHISIGSAMWSHAASGESATGAGTTATTTTSKRKGKTSARNGESVAVVREQHPGTGTMMMSQRGGGMFQNQGSGSSLTPSMMRNPSQESGASTMSPFTQATSIQSSSSSQQHSSQGRMAVSASTTPFTGSASPSPAALGRASLSLGPAQAQPLSAQSSFGSVAFSIPESVATTSSGGSGGETSASTRGTNQSLGPHRTTRQNPTRRFDPVVPASVTSNTGGLRPFNSTQNNNNRPRDTFNTLAAQIASEFPQARTTSSDSPATNASTAVRTRNTRKRPQQSRTRPFSGLRSSKKQLRRGGNGSDEESQSEGSEEEENGESEEDEDEYVPSGSARRKGRRR